MKELWMFFTGNSVRVLCPEDKLESMIDIVRGCVKCLNEGGECATAVFHTAEGDVVLYLTKANFIGRMVVDHKPVTNSDKALELQALQAKIGLEYLNTIKGL